MRKTPPRGPLAESEEAVFADFSERIDLANARVAEIGGALPETLARDHGVARWYAIDPRLPYQSGAGPRSAVSVVRPVRARAEAMPLPDSSVEAVFSSNAFQFLDVRATLAEAGRILKRGGLLYAHFGPIWPAPDGHQLEYLSYQGRDLVFWRDTLLPAWSHLRHSKEELRALLRTRLPTDLADLLVWHVHDSGTVNRMFFEDYVAAALGSGLEWVEVSASSHLDYEITTPAYDYSVLKSPDIRCEPLSALVTRTTGAPRLLGIRDVRLVLRRPDAG